MLALYLINNIFGFRYYLLSDNQRTFFQVVTDILHLQGQKLTTYKGNYDTFERTREEQLKNQQKAFEANERTRTHMQVAPKQKTAQLAFFSLLMSSTCAMDSVCMDLRIAYVVISLLFLIYHLMLHMNEFPCASMLPSVFLLFILIFLNQRKATSIEKQMKEKEGM